MGNNSIFKDLNEAIEHLSKLSVLEYAIERKKIAIKFDLQLSILDKTVNEFKEKQEIDKFIPPGPDPWPEPVDPATLLTEISSTIRRFVVLEQAQADAATLWIAMTYFMDVIQTAPIAIITAPEKACGKSQLLGVMGRLAKRAMNYTQSSDTFKLTNITIF